jgi:hypothetical protein
MTNCITCKTPIRADDAYNAPGGLICQICHSDRELADTPSFPLASSIVVGVCLIASLSVSITGPTPFVVTSASVLAVVGLLLVVWARPDRLLNAPITRTPGRVNGAAIGIALLIHAARHFLGAITTVS